MITSFRIENFKCFKNFELSDMTQLVLISGKNNTGKTSVLEGMFLFLDHRTAESFPKLCRFRGMNMSINNAIWDINFNNMNVETPIRLTACDDNVESVLTYSIDKNFVPQNNTVSPELMSQFVAAAKSNYSLMYKYSTAGGEETGHFTISNAGILGSKDNNASEEVRHAQFINFMTAGSDMTINEWFGHIELSGKKDKVIEVLQIIEPKLKDIRAIPILGQTMLYASIEGQLMPLKLCGDGLNRLLYIICSIMENKDSIIFIDEIETGFHYSVYNQIWCLIATAAKENNSQLVITTHSFECIAAAIEGVKDADMCPEFTYYRLDRNGDTRANRFSYEMLSDAIDANMEVR